jgi:DNA recombination protein RmuC
MEWIYLIVGLIAGGVLGYVIVNLSAKAKILDAEKSIEQVTSKSFEEKSELDADKRVLQNQLQTVTKEKESLLQKVDSATKAREEAEKKVVAQESAFQNLKEKLDNERNQLEKLESKFQKEFENIANKILKQNSFEFNQTSNKNLNDILTPLKDKLEKFEDKVQQTYEKGLKDQTDLRAELKNLQELSLRLDKDARNLTNALKADTKKQGSWGEMVLERILEESGLVKGQEYFVQESGQHEDGRRLRPDVVIKLPEGKHLIIDSKVSLTAYQAFVNGEDEALKARDLKKHIDSVKNHVKELNDKNYTAIKGINSPDFVLMFMPIEPAFALALQSDQDLFNFAWERKIVIVSPTTLLATLRTIESIWRQEKQTRNALEIASQGGKLYDKFVGFLTDLEKIGTNLNRASDAYQDAHKKLSSGKGNILTQVEKMKTLGAKTSKSLPQQYLELED